jgi:predicted RNA-binding protein
MKTPRAGELQMQIRDEDTVTLSDVLIGDYDETRGEVTTLRQDFNRYYVSYCVPPEVVNDWKAVWS